MSEAQMLAQSAGRLFESLMTHGPATTNDDWFSSAWAAVEDMGLPLALVPADAGGFGIEIGDALGLVRLAGYHALPLPLVETMVANRLLAASGVALAEGPASIVARTADRVAWGRQAAVLAVAGEHGSIARVTGHSVVEQGANLAGMPRDVLRWSQDRQAARSSDHSPLLWGAAIRSLQIAGAMERILRLTIDHVSERQQFGRPLAKFQVIQHDVARLGSEVAASSAAADMAAEAISGSSDPTLAIAAARIRIGEAVGVATSIAQQLHGAIGFTREHALHRYTTALWSWRDEFGGHGYWSQLLGRAALTAGAGGYWAFVTEAA